MGKIQPYSKFNKCLVCGSKKLTKYLSLGSQAFANSYLKKSQLKKCEYKAPLEVNFCHNCNPAQLLQIVDRDLIYNNCAYFSSTSPILVKHFEEYAELTFKRFPKQAKKLVLDIGSNDGILFRSFKKLGVRVPDINPAKEYCQSCQQQWN